MMLTILLLFATFISLASSKLTIYHGRVFFGGSNPMVLVQQVQGVATLALGGNPVSQFFDCNSTTGSNAIANLVWEKEGGNIRFAIQERSKRKRLDLVQSNGGPLLNYDDEGIYTCRDIVTGESVSLNVTGGTLAVCPAEPTYEAILGTNVSLTVYVAGFPAVKGEEIEWHDPSNLRLLNSSLPIRQMLVDSNKTLLIQNVRISDGGTYRIDLRRHITRNSFLNVTSTIELNVLRMPTIESNPSSMLVLEHDDVTFSCTFSGNPSPIIIWEREGGAMLPVVTRTTTTSLTTTNHTIWNFMVRSEYTIRGVFLEDMGGYRCSARNSALPTSVKTTFAILNITPRLQLRAKVGGLIVAISDSRILVITNTPIVIEIECVGSGTLTWRASTGTTIPLIMSPSNPADNIYQRSDSTSNKQTLIIQRFMPSNRAVYTCSTNFGSLDISEAILITGSATDIYITEAVIYATPGNSISIYAVYTSPSTPIITWSFNGSVLDTASHPRYTASLDGNMMAVLSIASVAQDVLGYYMVVIEVEGVIQNDNVRLLYPAPPTSSIQPTSLSADEGERVQFQCQVGGTDSTAHWTLEGNQPLPSGVTQKETKIVILSASRSNAGHYVCTVVNDLGISSSTATLIVLYPPMATVTHEDTSQTSINQMLEVMVEEGDHGLTFSCSSDGYPTPDLKWMVPVSGGNFPNGVAQNRQGTDQMLVWNRNLVYMDSGFYNCVAQNSRGSSVGTLNLLVKRSPTITSIYSSSTSPITSSSTSSFLVTLNHTGNILTCSGYGWPPPSIEWVRGGKSLTGRIPATGKNQAFVSARLTLQEGERFGQSHVGDYSCIMWPGDGSNQTYTKVVTLTSSISGVTSTPLPTCTSKSSQKNFQIRVLDTECENWEDSLKEHIKRDFQNEMLNIISTECPNCTATEASVTILDTPTCSSELQGAAVFRGSITTGGADTTEDIYCTLDAWYRAGPLLQVNNKLYVVDQKCSLMLDIITSVECTVPTTTTKDTPIFVISLVVVVLVAVAVMCIIIAICCCYSHAKKATVNMELNENDSVHERLTHSGPDVMTIENGAYGVSMETTKQVGEKHHIGRSIDFGLDVIMQNTAAYETSSEAYDEVRVEHD